MVDLLKDPGTLIYMISNNYSGNTAFSANQDTANTEGAHNIH
jgi:hypothetical protein